MKGELSQTIWLKSKRVALLRSILVTDRRYGKSGQFRSLEDVFQGVVDPTWKAGGSWYCSKFDCFTGIQGRRVNKWTQILDQSVTLVNISTPTNIRIYAFVSTNLRKQMSKHIHAQNFTRINVRINICD